MGILGLGEYLKKKEVPYREDINLEVFSGTRIAIDTALWTCKYSGGSVAEEIDSMINVLDEINYDKIFNNLLKHFVRFNLTFMRKHITPVWIYDGISKDEKLQTKVNRREVVEKNKETMKNMKEALLQFDILERPSDLVTKYKRQLKNTVRLPWKYINKLKEFSERMGLPTITADDEGENLCAYLAVERIVSAAWTTDRDTYAIGCPIVLDKHKSFGNSVKITVSYVPKILKHFDINYDQFRDFCIMCGTDFNQRVSGLGPAKAMELIKKYGCLDEIEKNTNYCLQPLRHRLIRDFFYPKESGFLGRESELNITEGCIEKFEEYEKYEEEIYELRCAMDSVREPKNIPKIL